MSCPVRPLILPLSASSLALLVGSFASAQVPIPVEAASSGDRVLGIDVSAWQSDITEVEWATFKRPTNQQVGGVSGDGRDFVFIRASRGGTTGEYHPGGGYPTNDNDEFWGSQRYDDPYYIRNITRATAAGMLAGSYHFSRPDVIASTPNSSPPGGTAGVANSGADEADHFIQMAGAFMRPGWLLPVHDFEAGDGVRSDTELTQFCLDFSNRFHQVMGFRPAMYFNGNYAGILANSGALVPQVVPSHPTAWVARWPNQANPSAIAVQTDHPGTSIPTVYGPWDDGGTTHPWVFWQYASTARLNGNNLGASNTDVNVAQGDIEFVKDYLVPALWTNANSGNWHDLANWNSGQAPIVPTVSPGQLARIGPLTLPTARLPGQPDTVHTNVTGADDTVNLNRVNENITVTLSQGAYNIRRLNLNETLVVTGGNLDARLTGWVGAGGTLALSGGNVTFDRAFVTNGGALTFTGGGTLNVGTLDLETNVAFTGASGTGQLLAKNGFANPSLDLNGSRTFTVAQGSDAIDLRIGVPLANGGTLLKDGDGTLELTGNNSNSTANVTVNRGHLLLTASNQLGAGGVVQIQTDAATDFGGTVRISGNGLSFADTIPLTIQGSGAAVGSSSGGALENVAGNNTWAGPVFLVGTDTNINNQFLNQIAATDGVLTLSGVVQKKAGVTLTTALTKTGAGDLVLTGTATNPNRNMYDGLTRIFGGRLILEKNGALGADGSDSNTIGNTFQLAGVSSSIAFRAPGESAGLDYIANEWIFTHGTGIGGGIANDNPLAQGQIDNISGNNTFAGHVAVAGPVGAGGLQNAYLGVASGSLEIKGGVHANSTTGAQSRNLFKRGVGTLILSGDSATEGNSNAGLLTNSNFTIQAGTVQLKGTAGNTANIPGVTSWNMPTGGTLAVAKIGAAGAAALNFTGGTLRTDAALAESNFTALGAGGGTLDSNGFDSSLNGVVSGAGSLTKTGTGKLTLGGAVNAFAGPLTLNNGTLAIAQNGGDSSIANINGLTITGGATLDLVDNDLIVRTTPASTIEAMVASGFNGPFGGGGWLGTGIISSAAAANGAVHMLGVAANANLELSTFGGHSGLTGAETFIRYTFVGDADLSGVVNGIDFLRFQSGFENTNPDAWTYGDFNYSGQVDAADFSLYLFGYLNQPGGISPSGQLLSDMTTFAVQYGLDTSAIPEPSGLALLLAGAGLLLRRKRRVRNEGAFLVGAF